MEVDALTQARTHIESAWATFMADRNLKARLPDWQTLPGSEGAQSLSVEVVGKAAAYALERFVTSGQIGLPRPGDTRPLIDYTVPGRTSYVWRSFGVWVELWVPDSAVQVSGPARPGVPAAGLTDPVPPTLTGPRSLAGRASGRLPFTRRNRKAPAA